MTIAVKTSLPQSYGLSRQPLSIQSYKNGTTDRQSNSVVVQTPQTLLNQNIRGTKTIADTFEPLNDGGYKRTRIFEQSDGRVFLKQEEINFKDNTITKTVVQQNPSGSVTQYEDVLDKQLDGAYRRTQRFLNEVGEISTQITNNYTTTDPFILTGGQSGFVPDNFGYLNLRGTRLDLSA